MDTQTGQPPPFHYMFDANAHGLGAGAQMEVSKYPGGSIQQYMSGYRQFKPVPGRGFVYGPSGNWGNRHYYKYTPIKQNAGASGVLSQIAQPNAYKYKVANLGRLGRVDPQLPRGGSIMRVVGVAGNGSEDMRAFDSSYGWSNRGQPGPADVREQTDVGRADLPGVPVVTNVPEAVEQTAVLKEPFEEQRAEFRVVNGVPESASSSGSSGDSPSIPQIPTEAIVPDSAVAAPGNVNQLPSPSVSEMSVDSLASMLRMALIARNIDEAVAMEIDEFEEAMVEYRGAGAMIPATENFQVESRVNALIGSLRSAMTENEAELPANVLVMLGEIVDGMEDVLADYQNDRVSAEELHYYLRGLYNDYRQALQQAAGGSSSGGSSPIVQQPAQITRRRSSGGSSRLSLGSRTGDGKYRKRDNDTLSKARKRRGVRKRTAKRLQAVVKKI